MKQQGCNPKNNSNIINNRKIINGYDDGLMQVHPLKHPLSMEIFQKMICQYLDATRK